MAQNERGASTVVCSRFPVNSVLGLTALFQLYLLYACLHDPLSLGKTSYKEWILIE